MWESNQTCSSHAIRPVSGRTQAGHGAQHGRLAGARRSDERDGLALGGQAELEPVGAKGEGDVELERRHVESSL